MPSKERPGTPSIADGTSTPCQCIELGTARRLVTRSVTVSPSRHRRTGAGMRPLMSVAGRGRPVTFTTCSPISRWKSAPESAAAPGDDALGSPAAPMRSGTAVRLVTIPLSPSTNRRREAFMHAVSARVELVQIHRDRARIVALFGQQPRAPARIEDEHRAAVVHRVVPVAVRGLAVVGDPLALAQYRERAVIPAQTDELGSESADVALHHRRRIPRR